MKSLQFAVPLLVAAAGVFAQPSEFSETTSVVVAEVPVKVSRDGEPVRGLTAEDFKILDRGEPRSLLGFEVVDLEAVGGPEALQEIPVAAQRHFLLLFDLAFSRPMTLRGSIAGSRELLTSLHG